MRRAGIALVMTMAITAADALSPSFPPSATEADYAVAQKLNVAIEHGDLREAQSLFAADINLSFDGLLLRQSKASSLAAMDQRYFGNWKSTTCRQVRIDRVAVSRRKIMVFVSFPGGAACQYPERFNQVQIYRLTGDAMISNIDFWPVNV